MKYQIMDVLTGRVYRESDSYREMANVFFLIEDIFYGGESEDLFLIDTETGRAVSVVVPDA